MYVPEKTNNPFVPPNGYPNGNMDNHNPYNEKEFYSPPDERGYASDRFPEEEEEASSSPAAGIALVLALLSFFTLFSTAVNILLALIAMLLAGVGYRKTDDTPSGIAKAALSFAIISLVLEFFMLIFADSIERGILNALL